MAPKKKKSRKRSTQTSHRPPASDPNPTTTSPTTSVSTGGAATSSLLPSPAPPSAPPTAATSTQPVLSAPIPPPSLASAIATTQPPPPAPPLSIQETHQEHISGTSVGTTTAIDSAGPSTASTSIPSVLLPITEEFLFRFLPKFISTMLATEELREMVPVATGSQPRPTDSELRTFLEVAEKGMKAAKDFVGDMEALVGALGEPLRLLEEEEMNWDFGSVDSCGGSKREEGGGPDSGSGGGGGGGGDGQGGGVRV